MIRLPRRFLALLLTAALLFGAGGCKQWGSGSYRLNPEDPVTIVVWHYYNGAILNAFKAMLEEFNETVGREQGIIIEDIGFNNMSDLEKNVMDSANGAVGSMPMPNIFSSYADTAFAAEKIGLLANLGDYFTKAELDEYLDSYIEEGRIGSDGELRIFPIAKATEMFYLNETDWRPFAEANGFTTEDLKSIEGVARVSEAYYIWTEAQGSGGKAFFGRDSMANLFIVASMQFGTEIFSVSNGKASIDVNREVMRKIWDNYYLPYIGGAFYSYGRYRSDDAKVGDILAYVGSTSSASYSPGEVTADGRTYPVNGIVLPVPCFEGGERVMVQQGAGMVVTKDEGVIEYACSVFLKWFTEAENNIEFCALSGYMPVKKEAIDYERFMSAVMDGEEQFMDDITRETIRVSFESVNNGVLYTNKAFDGGVEARSVLERSLQDKAAADREIVVALIEEGKSREEAVAIFDTDENFQAWLDDLTAQLKEASEG